MAIFHCYVSSPEGRVLGEPFTLPMTDPAGAGIFANMTGVNIDGIHGAP